MTYKIIVNSFWLCCFLFSLTACHKESDKVIFPIQEKSFKEALKRSAENECEYIEDPCWNIRFCSPLSIISCGPLDDCEGEEIFNCLKNVLQEILNTACYLPDEATVKPFPNEETYPDITETYLIKEEAILANSSTFFDDLVDCHIEASMVNELLQTMETILRNDAPSAIYSPHDVTVHTSSAGSGSQRVRRVSLRVTWRV